jgi:hypothetical protein
MCRRATGSAFAVLAWVSLASLKWTSAEPAYRRSSPIVRRGFCRACGTPLTLQYDNASSSEIALHGGTLDAPEALEPQYNYGASQRLPWVNTSNLPDKNTKERW